MLSHLKSVKTMMSRKELRVFTDNQNLNQQLKEVSRLQTAKMMSYLVVRQWGCISWKMMNSSSPSVQIDVPLKDLLKWGFYNSDVAMTLSNSILILSKSSNGHLNISLTLNSMNIINI